MSVWNVLPKSVLPQQSTIQQIQQSEKWLFINYNNSKYRPENKMHNFIPNCCLFSVIFITFLLFFNFEGLKCRRKENFSWKFKVSTCFYCLQIKTKLLKSAGKKEQWEKTTLPFPPLPLPLFPLNTTKRKPDSLLCSPEELETLP